MQTELHPRYERKNGRYARDLAEGEWTLIAPFFSHPNRLGRPRKVVLCEVIKRSDIARGFDVLPHRWVVERTFAWRCRSRSRRLAKDFEATVERRAWLTNSSICMLTRRLVRV